MSGKYLDDTLLKAGISPQYIDTDGHTQAVSVQTKQQLLTAMRYPCIQQCQSAPIAKALVFSVGHRMTVTLQGRGKFSWTLTTESGDRQTGQADEHQRFHLPSGLDEGYHQLVICQGYKEWICQVIVAPERCYEPECLQQNKKIWGACVQLYTLRSEDNWGIGDFGDLRRMLLEVAARGGAFIGLNPLHALYPANPESASPYSPSSRRWLNIIYIDVNAVEDFMYSEEAQSWWQQPTTQQTWREVRDSEWVDYTRVSELKLTALRMAWRHFSQREEQDEQRQAFEQFAQEGGESLHYQAAYDAIHTEQMQEDATRWGWPVWPEAYRNASDPAVSAFCDEHVDDLKFWSWLQFIASNQLAACWQVSQQNNMPIGLYRDLAVGVALGSAQTWRDSALYCLDVTVGAPPDVLGPLGQNWGLPPMNPHIIEARGYAPFIELLRANMTLCGALRIDHAMSLLRLWWVPKGETPDKGAYVHYPIDELLGILALESKRHRCMIIGEVLGTIPDEIIGKLRNYGIYSYKVLYFEHDEEMAFLAPQAWPAQAMAVVTTHDLPTLRGYWQSVDLTLGRRLGLYPDNAVLHALYLDRIRAKQGLLNTLYHYGFIPERQTQDASKIEMTATLNRGVQRYIAESASRLLGLQPEDWLDMAEPVNVPGTNRQYKNWRRKLNASLEAIFADKRINRLLEEVNRQREQPCQQDE